MAPHAETPSASPITNNFRIFDERMSFPIYPFRSEFNYSRLTAYVESYSAGCSTHILFHRMARWGKRSGDTRNGGCPLFAMIGSIPA